MAERTIVLPCNCNHEYQDQTYGKGLRLHNTNKDGKAFCTVCSPSYRRNKVGADISASPGIGNVFIKGRGSRNPKQVTP